VSPAAELADQALAALTGRAPARPGSVFTSDLSVDEAILVAEAGYEPRRLVMGSSIFHIGYVYAQGPAGPAGFGALPEGELVPLTQAMYQARAAAMGRLAEDAVAAGGTGVIGVRLTIRTHHAGRSLAEFTAVGTAVAPAGGVRARPVGAVRCFTSDLSGQDFYLLTRAGFEPLGLVVGNCVYRAAASYGTRLATANAELPGPTAALARARERAMERLQAEARRLGAEGVVGVRVSERSHAGWTRAIEFLAIGTAVRRRGTAEPGGLGIVPVVQVDDPEPTADPSAITGGRHAPLGGAGEG